MIRVFGGSIHVWGHVMVSRSVNLGWTISVRSCWNPSNLKLLSVFHQSRETRRKHSFSINGTENLCSVWWIWCNQKSIESMKRRTGNEPITVVVSDFISRRVVIWTDCSWGAVVDCAGWMFASRWMWVCPSSFVGATSKYFRAQRAALHFYAHINHAFRLSFQCLSCPAPLGLLWSTFGGRECVFECGLSRCRLSCIALSRIFYVTQKKRRAT